MNGNDFCVYILTLTKTGVFYIGSTSNLKKRLRTHFRSLKRNNHHNLRLQEAWCEGTDYKVSSIPCSSREEAFQLEEKLIIKSYTGLNKNLLANISLNSKFGNSLSNHPKRDDILDRRNKTQAKNIASMSVLERKNLWGKNGSANGMFGRQHSVETRKLISLMHKGHSYNKGCKLSEEQIEKIRARQRLRTGSKNSFFNRKHTEETKRKLRENRIGIPPTNTRKVFAGGILFNSCADASRYFKISQGLVTHRVKKDKYKDWFYHTEVN
jgi:group I intron endonuclease